ncbi:PDZ domain-containing protein [Flavobacterium sp. N1719]|uniref:M61 family metallopeptidase n=1 Tax=Flavobacterium sp. N1719 TaxID=2885633 RepID=UPI00222138FC|nr:PDZ domain-containing protein [Flavobacterium sp. N1719]
MKKILLSFATALFIIGCGSAPKTEQLRNDVGVHLDLIQVKDDKVKVTITAPTIQETEIVYHLPKIIPGTYSEDDYGKMIEEVKAFDKDGNPLTVTTLDKNSWSIKDAQKLKTLTYFVNDTYDTEKSMRFGEGIFSPAGTNILADKNFMINQHGFIGYFEGKKDLPYLVKISHPEGLFGATSLTDSDPSSTEDLFLANRYSELVDNPIMYAKPDYTTFTVDGMEILFSIYSPSGKHNAAALSPDIERMIRAQKKFLGPINNNKKYSILLYLSNVTGADAKGFGALEHNTSTTVVFPEMMGKEMLGKQLIDVVSHEFFHIVTPLGVHSNEIHYFDFNAPKMSQHLWMYEGITEYFANLFQVNQGLISEDDFYGRMRSKIKNAKQFKDNMSFTEMSQNVLKAPYKDQYTNVYEKGALIGMCLDIIIREKSNGERGVLDLMQKLTNEFGPSRPFEDSALFDRVVALTYPEVGDFLRTHVSGTTPIDYDVYFAKMGVGKGKVKKKDNPFFLKYTPCITANAEKQITVRESVELSEFMKSMGLKANDVIVAINEKAFSMDDIASLMDTVQQWNENESVTLTIKRDGKTLTLKGKALFSYSESEGFMVIDSTKNRLKESWLKG